MFNIVGPSTVATSYAPKAWTFEGSDDGIGWTVLDTQTNQTGWATAETRTYSFPTAASYKRYRLNITANNGSAQVGLDELRIIGSHVPNATRWFDLSAKKMKVWNGSAWQVDPCVFLGDATTDGTSVTSVTTYALNAEYRSSWTPISLSTTYNFNHNLGYPPDQIQMDALIRDTLNGFVLPFHVDSNADYSWVNNNFAMYPDKDDRKRFSYRSPSQWLFNYGDTAGVSHYSNAAGGSQLIVTLRRNW